MNKFSNNNQISKWSCFIFLALSLIIISGCSSQEPLVRKPRPLDGASVALAEAAESTSESMANLEAIKLKQEPMVILDQPSDNPVNYGLGRMASVDWAGPIQSLLETIGALTDYRIKVIGKEPTLPILVSIYNHNVMVGDVIRNARLQAEGRAKIVVYPKDKLIELRYLAG